MKWLHLLFASYLLLLCLMPCHDGSEITKGKTEVAAVHSHENEKEHCPPLCSCTCCSVSFIEVHACEFADEAGMASFEKQLPEYRFNFPKTIPAGIWQPPKIA